eukprot:861420_1
MQICISLLCVMPCIFGCSYILSGCTHYTVIRACLSPLFKPKTQSYVSPLFKPKTQSYVSPLEYPTYNPINCLQMSDSSSDEEEIDSNFSQMELLLNTHNTWADLRVCLNVPNDFFPSNKIELKKLKATSALVEAKRYGKVKNIISQIVSSRLMDNLNRLLKYGIGIECAFLILKHQVRFLEWTHGVEGHTIAPNLIKDTMIPYYNNVRNKTVDVDGYNDSSEDSDLSRSASIADVQDLDEIDMLRQQVRELKAEVNALNANRQRVEQTGTRRTLLTHGIFLGDWMMETQILPFLKSIEDVELDYKFKTIEFKLGRNFIRNVLEIDGVMLTRMENGSTTELRYVNPRSRKRKTKETGTSLMDTETSHIHMSWYRSDRIFIIKCFGYINKNKFVASSNSNNSNNNSNSK